jgi:cytochrome c oxidase subunit 1
VTVLTDHHAAPPAPAGLRRLTAPGWLRVLWVTPIFFGFGLGLPLLVRWLAHWDPVWKGSVLVTVELVTTPIGFLVGIGGFDYWAHYASGRPTRIDDHSGHGARSWRDYFRNNTDHKVIGVQYLVTTIIFFCIGGLLAMLFRA